jgi:hypothetical protein
VVNGKKMTVGSDVGIDNVEGNDKFCPCEPTELKPLQIRFFLLGRTGDNAILQSVAERLQMLR